MQDITTIVADRTTANQLASIIVWSSIACAIAAFGISLIVEQKKDNLNDLAAHTARAASALTIPSGLALIFCAFRPGVIQFVPGLNLVLVVAALAFLFVAVKAAAR